MHSCLIRKKPIADFKRRCCLIDRRLCWRQEFSILNCYSARSSQDDIARIRKRRRGRNMLNRSGNTTDNLCFRYRFRDVFSRFRCCVYNGTGPLLRKHNGNMELNVSATFQKYGNMWFRPVRLTFSSSNSCAPLIECQFCHANAWHDSAWVSSADYKELADAFEKLVEIRKALKIIFLTNSS